MKCEEIQKYVGPAVGAGALMVPNLAFAVDGGVTSSTFSSVLSALTGQISTTTVVEVITTAVTASVGLAFMWWGVRKVTQILMAAFRKGRVSVG